MNDFQVLQQLRAEVEITRRANPEMDEDDKLFADMIEGCTDVNDLIGNWVREYFDRKAIADRLRERADLFERQADARKSWIKTARMVARITGKQTFPEGTVFETRKRDELIYDPDKVPAEYKKVDETSLRKAVKDGQTTIARLVPSNEPPTLNIRTK